jgi:2-desacetyl-2-hydroxyethyl bacteriochlorophyllide A dehydrogenase
MAMSARRMKAVVFERKESLEIKEVPVPEIGALDVLVHPEAVGVCATDVHIFHGEFIPTYPLIPGHEPAGVVVETGSDVEGLKPGDQVMIDPSVFCEACYFCRQNLQNHCLNWNGIGVTRNGCFAEFVRVPAKNCYPFSGLSFSEAAMAEPLACVVYGQERARMPLGADVLIFGAGPIGCLHLLTSKVNGAARVTMVDLRQDKLEAAARLGADVTVVSNDRLAEVLREVAPYGFDVVIDATGVAKVVEKAIDFVKPTGRLLVFGVCHPAETMAVRPFDIYKRDIEIIGSFAIRKTYAPAAELLKSGAIDVKPLIADVLPLEKFGKALELVESGRAAMKVQIVFE